MPKTVGKNNTSKVLLMSLPSPPPPPPSIASYQMRPGQNQESLHRILLEIENKCNLINAKVRQGGMQKTIGKNNTCTSKFLLMFPSPTPTTPPPQPPTPPPTQEDKGVSSYRRLHSTSYLRGLGRFQHDFFTASSTIALTSFPRVFTTPLSLSPMEASWSR